MSDNNTNNEERFIVIITTPPWVKNKIEVTALMSQAELDEAKQERPDLVFTIPVEKEEELQVEPVTVKGMTLLY